MHVFITGGTGFIGANLTAALNQRGITPRLLHRQTSSRQALAGLAYESVIGDVLDSPETLAAALEGCEWVFHVAAVADYWRQQPDWVYRVNVGGTQNVLQAARLAGVSRLVFTSSMAAMGVPASGELLTEDSPFNLPPQAWPYGHSKFMAEIEVRKAVEAGLEAVIVNPAVVLGPRDVNQISGSIIVEAARGLAKMNLPGGTNYVAVQDVVAGHLAAAEKGRAGERYILGHINLPHAEALATICQVLEKRPPTLNLPRWSLPLAAAGVRASRRVLGNRVPFDENQVRMLGAFVYADVTKATRELDLPRTPFLQVVQETVAWYRTQGII
ncbi:MAG: NAD-dependent epimerase/dehydratase family protein [Ardenticatenales bacterium]|nr:NAD-dependent epimerase/dehydratase family protein [Ardenticatenales bacterium]